MLGGALYALADLFTFVAFMLYAGLGAFLVTRRPSNAVSWLVFGLAFGFVLTTAPATLSEEALRDGTAPWSQFLVAWYGSWAGYATFAGYLALMVLFPTGSFTTGGWGRVAKIVLAVIVAVVLLDAFSPTVEFSPGGEASYLIPNRFAILPQLSLWSFVTSDLLLLVSLVLLGGCAVSMIVRYRRATSVLKLQLRWLVATLSLVVATVATALAAMLVLGEENVGDVVWLPAIVAYLTVPVAIAVAVLRYRLYEIDRIISRTVSWALVTAILGASFVVGLVGLQALLAGFTDSDTVAVAASTLLAFALFQPVRRRVQAVVDRRFDRQRYDATRVVETFSARLRDQLELGSLGREIGTVAGETVRPSMVGVWLRQRPRS